MFGCKQKKKPVPKSGNPTSSVNPSDIPYLSLPSLTLRILQDFGTRWLKWVWPFDKQSILSDGSFNHLVPTPFPTLSHPVPTAMSHLPSSSVRDHMKWVCPQLSTNYVNELQWRIKILSIYILLLLCAAVAKYVPHLMHLEPIHFLFN